MANGVFDLLHVGHIRYLEEAKRRGDILIVGINDDISAQKLKGKGRPIFKEKERAELVASLESVDYVFIHKGETFDEPLLLLQPHLHAKGTDYSPSTVPEREVVKSYGGEIIITGDAKSHSSSEQIREIKRRIHES